MALGYDNTPLLPGGKWRVHDGNRPQPRVVDPGTASTPQQAGRPPSDATVLFAGGNVAQWQSARDGGPVTWRLEGDYMEVTPGSGDIRTKESFGDCQLHLEWAAPSVVKGDGQGRGNSGVFLMSVYEVQLLDCYQNPTYPDGTTAALYGQCPPLVNACRKPGEWQSYDILFVAPRFEGKNVVAPAFITVMQNGVVVQHHRALQGTTQHQSLSCYTQLVSKAPLQLQDHGDLVRFRNIWIRALDFYAEP